MKRKILVVVAHPDDEVLGCGATMKKYAEQGDECHVLIMAEGATSRSEKYDKTAWAEELEALQYAAKSAAEVLSVTSVRFGNFPDNRMDSIELLETVKVVEKVIEDIKPEIVITHHAGDVNIDHQLVHDAVITACRPLPGAEVRTVLFFETLSSTEYQIMTSSKVFLPNWFETVSASCIEKKIEALHCYASEMRQSPHARSYEAVKVLARYRGFQISKEYAEAFSLGRLIQ